MYEFPMEHRIEARKKLNESYKQIMSAFSSIYTQLEFGDNSNEEKLTQLAAFYTVVFIKAKNIPPITSHIDLYMSKNPEMFLDEADQHLAAEIIVENHIHELKLEGFIEVKSSDSGIYEISLTDQGKCESKKKGKDIRLL